MSKVTDELMAKHGVKPDAIHLPAGGVAVFGRTGNGKSTLFFYSQFLGRVIIADTGSMAHKLWAGDRAVVVTTTDPQRSPIDQVRDEVVACERAGRLSLVDSWSTLQEQQVAWFKQNVSRKRGTISIPEHGEIVGQLRDLALVLAQAQAFTIFNTTAGGSGKTPSGEVVHYPAGAITGYPSLNGTEANKEPVLARWGSVWGMFKGWPEKGLPRGLYVPSNDIRPDGHDKYAPLKDPYGVIRDTSDGKGVMAVPSREDEANAGRCFADELLVEIAARFPKARPAAAPPAAGRAPK
jgi:hypothetical protein